MKTNSMLRDVLFSLLLMVQISAPLAAQSSVSDKIAVVRAQGATLFPVDGQPQGLAIAAGSLLIVKGRSADNSQLFVISEEGQSGWVAANSLLLVNIASLPVMDAESAAASDTSSNPTPAPESAQANQIEATSPLTETMSVMSTVDPTPKNTVSTSKPGSASGSDITARIKTTTERLNLRQGPGVNYAVVRTAAADSEWIAVGRNAQSTWVQLASAETDEPMWASAAYLTLSAPIGQLPLRADLPPPPPTATPAPTLSTSTSNNNESATNQTPATNEQLAATTSNGKSGLSGTLVFQDRIGGTIYAYNLASGALRTLTGGIDPAISPDGKLVAFTRDGDGGGLFVINIDGSGERRLYGDKELLRSPKWSPDGGKIVFSRSSGFVDCRILQGRVCMPDEAIFDLLPEELQGDAITQKAVKDLPNRRQYFFTLSRVRLDNGEFRDVASKGAAGAPDWTYGGIVYQSDNGLQRTSDDSSGDSTMIAQDIQVGNYIDPDQQPNGGRIVFQHSRGGHWQIYGVNPDGSGMAALTTLATVMVDALPSSVSPAWSPDGQQIVYLSNRNSYESAGPWHLWVMNADGSNQRRLPIEVEFTYSFGSEQMVSWGE